MSQASDSIPAYDLYGETRLFPDIMHCERIVDRASGLGWTIAPHRHGILHQFFHLDGAGAEVSLDGHRIRIERPSLISVPRFAVHAFRFPGGQEGHVLSVLPDTLPELFGDAPEPLSQWRMVHAPAGIGALFDAIRGELAGALPLRNAVLRARAVEIAAAVLRSEGEGGGDAPPPALRHMRRFEALIRADPAARRPVGDYAREIGVSAEHLGRITRAMAGQSPAQFIDARRMQEARRHLAYTRLSVASVAHALGYDDPAYFSRAFRRAEGVSPSAYRASRSETA
ncbi:helix-turn-helix domain-containing protein [Palleronia marisminoris]|nr:helix-turn-helix domain-containing protein [Palleronia marisminoris]